MRFQADISPVVELVPSTIDTLLNEITREVRLSDDESFQVRLILEEAITNAITHGIKCDTGLKVHVTIAVEGDRLRMSVKDEGPGFDYHNCPDPLADENAFKSHGRGIYLMRKYADEVSFNASGNEIIITKKIGGRP